MPPHRRPRVWSAVCTLEGSETAEHIDAACRSWKLEKQETRALLVLEEPLAWFTFGVAWEGAGQAAPPPGGTSASPA